MELPLLIKFITFNNPGTHAHIFHERTGFHCHKFSKVSAFREHNHPKNHG
ncbi:hypothetical protein ECFRIK523_5904, partial [Escherichia coli FRIK523]